MAHGMNGRHSDYQSYPPRGNAKRPLAPTTPPSIGMPTHRVELSKTTPASQSPVESNRSHRRRIIATGSALLTVIGVISAPGDVSQVWHSAVGLFSSDHKQQPKPAQPKPQSQIIRKQPAPAAVHPAMSEDKIVAITDAACQAKRTFSVGNPPEYYVEKTTQMVIRHNESRISSDRAAGVDMTVPKNVHVGQITLCGGGVTLEVGGTVDRVYLSGGGATLMVKGTVGDAYLFGGGATIYADGSVHEAYLAGQSIVDDQSKAHIGFLYQSRPES